MSELTKEVEEVAQLFGKIDNYLPEDSIVVAAILVVAVLLMRVVDTLQDINNQFQYLRR